MTEPEKKKVWMRLGITLELTEEEIEAAKNGTGEGVIRDKIDRHDFVDDGDSYIPYTEGNDDDWSIEDNIDFVL